MGAKEEGRLDGNRGGPRDTDTTQKPLSTEEASARSMPDLSRVDKCCATDAPQKRIIPFADYTLAECAALLHVSERKVRDLVAAGHLPRLRHTRNFVVWGEDIIAYLRSMSRAQRGESS